VVWSKSNECAGAADITRKVTLTGADFTPAQDTDDWENLGIYVECEAGECTFMAPVVFPCLSSVTVERIKLHVNDYTSEYRAIATLHGAKPSQPSLRKLGRVRSPWGLSGGFQTYTSNPINKVVWPSERAYIKLTMGTDMLVYGVTIQYHPNT